MNRRGFTTLELLLVIAIFTVIMGIVFAALSGLQSGDALREGGVVVTDALRRAEIQAMSGYYGDAWGVHLSNSDGCALPAKTIWIFRGGSFTSATDTADAVALPAGSRVSALALGGGCDVTFGRFTGSTTSAGTITVSNANDDTVQIQVNKYGRVTPP